MGMATLIRELQVTRQSPSPAAGGLSSIRSLFGRPSPTCGHTMDRTKQRASSHEQGTWACRSDLSQDRSERRTDMKRMLKASPFRAHFSAPSAEGIARRPLLHKRRSVQRPVSVRINPPLSDT
jgi:hypothetical protein